jgi:hypothetical protein
LRRVAEIYSEKSEMGGASGRSSDRRNAADDWNDIVCQVKWPHFIVIIAEKAEI